MADDHTAAPEPEDRAEVVPERALATRSAPYPMSRLAPRFDLVDIAGEIQRADATVSVVVSAKLDLIRKQILALQEEARAVLDDAAHAARLHRAHCNFRKMAGHVYHLYRRDEEDLYFSMLSPDEWRGKPPHAYEGSYRLENDQSFTRIDVP